MVPNHNESCLKPLLLQGTDPKMFPYVSVGNNGEVTLDLKSKKLHQITQALKLKPFYSNFTGIQLPEVSVEFTVMCLQCRIS